jgi:hypothetical protein
MAAEYIFDAVIIVTDCVAYKLVSIEVINCLILICALTLIMRDLTYSGAAEKEVLEDIAPSSSLSGFPFVDCLTMKTGTVVSLNFGN